ncbi:MAG TPA: glutamate--tRNA ligase [Kiloniellaceae bacterium]|nr:glutamate--tRNA ligase [Kiloniellaceae bacterium]
MSSGSTPVVTRFAPSPTGFLHIGGARTALFNWLFTRHHQGTFRLRIEDTDRQRSTEAAVSAILEGLKWLELDWDGDEVYQFAGADRHAEVARQLLAEGKAYRCYCTPEELKEMREKARAEGGHQGYDGRWRDRDPADAPAGVDPVIRLKMPRDGETVIADAVQGEVKVANAQLDDMVLLRADGTPTYMLSVVVDDRDMGITHVIRGDDHLTNAFRQTQLFRAMGWPVPTFAHIPLIHGPDGAKLSKRHGALGVEAYRAMGYLPEALCNYLLRLGWSHGDEEIIARDQAVAWFDLPGINKAAARFDFDKLGALNGHYIREADDGRLADLVAPLLARDLERALTAEEHGLLKGALPSLKARARTLEELAAGAAFYFAPRPLSYNEKAQKLLTPEAQERLAALADRLAGLDAWEQEAIEGAVRGFAEDEDLKLGAVAQPLRAALTGSNASPGIFEVMALLGQAESLARVRDAAEAAL